MRESFNYLYKHIDETTRKRLWIFLVVGFLSPILNLFGISAILPIMNRMLSGTSGNGDIILAMAMALLMLISGGFEIYSNRLAGLLSYEGSHIMSMKLYELTLKEDLLAHYDRDAMRALALIRTDTQKCVEMLKAYIWSFVSVITMGLFVIFLIITDGWVGVIVSLFVLCEVALVYLKNRRIMVEFGEKIRESDIQTNSQVTTAFGAYKELKTEGNPINFIEKYEDKSRQSADLKISYSNKNAFIGVVMKNCIYTIMFLVLAVIMLLTIDMTAYLSQTVVTVMVIIRLLPLGNKVVTSINTVKGAQKSYECIREAFEKYEQVKKQEESASLLRQKEATLKEGIKIRNLCFAYPNGKKIFDNADMDIPTGSTVAIIGPSGAGKTTFLDLLLGLLKPQSGQIFYDDYDCVSKTDKDGKCLCNIGRLVSYIPQVVFMNGSTVRENVAFFENAKAVDDERVEACLKSACILDDVMGMPLKTETLIGPGGVEISGGQRQRIALARALYKEFELLIMDEATSALDAETESAVMKSVRDVKGSRTLLMVTHHDAVSDDCDMVYKVTGGKIIRVK